MLGWVHTCNVTAYRNTVSWHCGRDSCPRNVPKVGYAVTLRACSVRCRYLAVASKGWYGYGQSRGGRATYPVPLKDFRRDTMWLSGKDLSGKPETQSTKKQEVQKHSELTAKTSDWRMSSGIWPWEAKSQHRLH